MPDDKKRRHDRDATLALFLLGRAAVKQFYDAINDARVDALTAAVLAAADALDVDVSEWEAPDSLLKQMAKESKVNAQSIVDTYNADATAEAERFAEHYNGNDLQAALKTDLTQFAKDRATWKSEQVSLYESGHGYSAGIDTLVGDLLDGSLDLPDGTTIADLVVTVNPDASSNDFCAEYAGNSYPLTEADNVLGLFPAHQNCIHWVSLDFA